MYTPSSTLMPVDINILTSMVSDSLEEKLRPIMAEIQEIKQEIQTMKSEISNIESDIESIKNRLEAMNAETTRTKRNRKSREEI